MHQMTPKSAANAVASTRNSLETSLAPAWCSRRRLVPYPAMVTRFLGPHTQVSSDSPKLAGRNAFLTLLNSLTSVFIRPLPTLPSSALAVCYMPPPKYGLDPDPLQSEYRQRCIAPDPASYGSSHRPANPTHGLHR